MVDFVGAGPGAEDLITLRGMRKLQEADVIIYAGSLVNPELLKYAKETCKIYDSSRMTLEEIIAVIEEKEAEKENTVRLHTGDPCLYGAIREQMAELDKRGIPYEICPGVSSFQAAAASLKKEYTVPGLTQSVIISRAEGRTSVPKKEELSQLASHGSSLVLFLSMGLLEKVKKELLSGAYKPDTPCAIVYKASWKEEKIIRGKLENLVQMAEENHIRKTALVVVGEFLGDAFERSRLYAPDFSTEYREAVR